MADDAAAGGIDAIVGDGGLGGPVAIAAGGPDQIGGVKHQREREPGGHNGDGQGGRTTAIVVGHRQRGAVGAGGGGDSGDESGGRIDSQPAWQAGGPIAGGLVGRRDLAGEWLADAAGGRDAVGDDRRLAARMVDDLVDPAGVRAGAHRQILGIAPAQCVGAGGDTDGFLLPVDRAGNGRGGRLLGTIQVEAQEIIGWLRRYLPPENKRAGTNDGGLEIAFLAIADSAAARRVLAIMGGDHLGLPIGIAAGDPGQGRSLERRAQGQGFAGDRQGQGAGAGAGRIGGAQRNRVGAAGGRSAGDEPGGRIESQARHRFQAGGRIAGRSVGGGDLVGKGLAKRTKGGTRTGDDRSLRSGREHDLVDPAGIGTGRYRLILHIEPAQRMAAGRDADRHLLPAQRPRDARGRCHLGIIQAEAEVVIAGFGRHLPPERQGPGAGDRGVEIALLVGADGAALRGIHAVMGSGRLGGPRRAAARAPGECRSIQRLGQSEHRRNRQKQAGGTGTDGIGGAEDHRRGACAGRRARDQAGVGIHRQAIRQAGRAIAGRASGRRDLVGKGSAWHPGGRDRTGDHRDAGIAIEHKRHRRA